MTFVKTWDEEKPAGTRARSLGDDDIREFKYAIRERLAVDHLFYDDESGHSDTGYHRQATLVDTVTDPTNVSGAGIVYAKTVSGVVELFYQDADGTITQMTTDGKLGSAALNGLLNDLDLDGTLTSDDITLDTNNTYLKAKNAAGTGTVDLIKASSGDVPMLPDGAQLATSAAPSNDNDIANKKYVDDNQPAFGAWTSKVNNTVYQAATDGWCVAYGTVSWNGTMNGYTDSSNPPTTLVAREGAGENVNNADVSLMFPVKSGDYYKVTGASVVYFVPIS